MTSDIAAATLSQLRIAIAAELVASPLPTRPRKRRLDALDVDANNLAVSTVDAWTKLGKAIELFDSFETRQPVTESAAPSQETPRILSDDSGLKFEWAVGVFQPITGASIADLQLSVRRWDWIASLIMLAGIAAVGVLVLWVPNAAWGTVQDVILAILAGAGTRLAIGAIAIPGAKSG